MNIAERAGGFVLAASLAYWCGCSTGPAKIDFPAVDPAAAATAAIQLADKNGDAAISKEEASAVPSLNAEFAKYDANSDGRIDAAEIESRIASWSARGGKVVPVSFYVKLDGRPLQGAEVVLEPEPFIGSVLATAKSNVSGSGACGPTVPQELLSKEVPVGVFSGLYRMKITHPERTIPAKYNEQTELGIEVAPDYDFFNRKTFELSSR